MKTKEIGKKAKELDKLSMKERAKLPKPTVKKLCLLFFIYCAIMVVLSFVI